MKAVIKVLPVVAALSSPAGGQVAVVLISPTALPEFTDNTPYSHYSLLKTILTAWNLPALGITGQASIKPITAPWTGQLGNATTKITTGITLAPAVSGSFNPLKIILVSRS